MAADAALVVEFLHDRRVVAAVDSDALRDFRVTFQTLDLLAPAGEPMAYIALCGPAKRLVCTRKWAGRDLRGRIQGPGQAEGQSCKRGDRPVSPRNQSSPAAGQDAEWLHKNHLLGKSLRL